jgi:hypothetical protein
VCKEKVTLKDFRERSADFREHLVNFREHSDQIQVHLRVLAHLQPINVPWGKKVFGGYMGEDESKWKVRV